MKNAEPASSSIVEKAGDWNRKLHARMDIEYWKEEWDLVIDLYHTLQHSKQFCRNVLRKKNCKKGDILSQIDVDAIFGTH